MVLTVGQRSQGIKSSECQYPSRSQHHSQRQCSSKGASQSLTWSFDGKRNLTT